MKESTTPSRICKLDLFKFNFQRWPKGSLEADYRLLAKDDWALGTHRYEGMWSQTTIDALSNLIECMEEDAMKTVFGSGVQYVSEEEKPYEEITTREHIEYEGDDIDMEMQL